MCKKINKYSASCLIMLLTMTMTGCKFEDDDYFDQSAAERIETTCDNLQDILAAGSAADKNGWLMQYFVNGTSDTNFRGYNMMARFTSDGKVTMTGNHEYLRDGNAGLMTEATSVYAITSEEGPVLSFSAWNDVLSPLSDPVNPLLAPSTIVKDGVGMGGDYNLVLGSYDAKEVQMFGQRYRNHIRLVQLELPWTQYVSATTEMKDYIASGEIDDYVVTAGTNIMYISGLSKGYYTYADRLDDPISYKIRSCVFTPTGFRAERADVIGDTEFQEFILSDDKSELLSLDGKVHCHAMWDTYINNKGLWLIDNENLSAEQKALCQQAETLVKSQYPTFTLRCVAIGMSQGKNPVNGMSLIFYKNAAKTSCISLGISLNRTLIAFGQEKIEETNPVTYDYNMGIVEEKAPGIESLATQIAQSFKGTYNMTPDNYFKPTAVTYQSGEDMLYTLRKNNNRIIIE